MCYGVLNGHLCHYLCFTPAPSHLQLVSYCRFVTAPPHLIQTSGSDSQGFNVPAIWSRPCHFQLTWTNHVPKQKKKKSQRVRWRSGGLEDYTHYFYPGNKCSHAARTFDHPEMSEGFAHRPVTLEGTSRIWIRCTDIFLLTNNAGVVIGMDPMLKKPIT